MRISAKQLASHLRKDLAPCYLVSGDEHLLVAEALDLLRDVARKQGFSSRELHVAETGFDWNELRESSANLSLFAEKRVLELRIPTGKPGQIGGQAIAELAAAQHPDVLFIVVTPKLDRKVAGAKWVKALDSAGAAVQIWPVERRDLPGWIGNRMRSAGLEPERDAVMLIAERVEGNLLAAAQEVEKLRLLLGAARVSADDVRSAVANNSRYDVYRLADAALAGDPRRALKILAGLHAEGLEPVIVVWALTRELRTLAKLEVLLKQGKALSSGMQEAGVWRTRQELVRKAIGRHRSGDCQRLLKACARADRAAKGQSSDDPWQLATDILLGLACGGQQAA